MTNVHKEPVPWTWRSQEHIELDKAAWLGLVDGDLEPLAEYLQSPYPLSRTIRDAIVWSIRGAGTLHQIVTRNVGGRTGSKSVRREIDNFVIDVAIAEFVECLMEDAGAEGPAPVRPKAAESIACELFGVSRAKVQSARRVYREGSGPTFCMRGWTEYQRGKRSPWPPTNSPE